MGGTGMAGSTKSNVQAVGDTVVAPKHHHYHHHHFPLERAAHVAWQYVHRTERTTDDSGGEQVRVWRDQQMARRRLIQETIAQRLIETHVQPIVDLRSGRPVGVEALSRFTAGPERSPDKWFADAAAVGLGVEMELLAVTVALGQLDLLPSGQYLSLNVSVDALLSDRLLDLLADVPAERVVLELTEELPGHELPRLDQRMADLRELGLRVAVDEPGTGTAGFRRILQLKPDIIKLDIGLTRGIGADPARRSFGRALLSFGLDACGATFIAEGIETQSELDSLRALGCPAGQGYLLGRPHRLTMRYMAPFTPMAPGPN
jgi:EAL domain-containing protein (putative c-di-GMP-specific phosphodiesterase class I)